MIIKEFYLEREDGVKLYKTYSDEGKYILKVGTDEEYREAVDLENVSYNYIETDKYIKPKEQVITEEYLD